MEELIKNLLSSGYNFCGANKNGACFASIYSNINFYLKDGADIALDSKKGAPYIKCKYWDIQFKDGDFYYKGDKLNTIPDELKQIAINRSRINH